jgi:hypothetical protein
MKIGYGHLNFRDLNMFHRKNMMKLERLTNNQVSKSSVAYPNNQEVPTRVKYLSEPEGSWKLFIHMCVEHLK